MFLNIRDEKHNPPPTIISVGGGYNFASVIKAVQKAVRACET